MELANDASSGTDEQSCSYPPAIGDYWPGQGGIYIGLAAADGDLPEGHLVLALATTDKSLTWKQSIAWAQEQSADGHSDFRLPTRFESALIYANGLKHVDADHWHWTGTPHNTSGSRAWLQYFDYGYQDWGDVDDEYCARAVRRFVL